MQAFAQRSVPIAYTGAVSQSSNPIGFPYHSLTRRSVLAGLAALSTDFFQPVRLHADANPNWTAAQPPYRIAGNLYYVGSRDLASFLITTPAGHILINSNLASSPRQIQTSVEKLGFRFKEIRILLISHAHLDHCAGSAEIKRLTGAKYMVMDADVSDAESGGRTNFQYSKDKSMYFPAAKVDRILHDGDQVRLANAVLTARKTPGHTQGCTTWTLPIPDEHLQQSLAHQHIANGGSKTFPAVIIGSPYVLASYNLVNAPNYPTMAADFRSTFHVLESLPCDIFLGAHGSYYNMLEKYLRLKAGDAAAFYDPVGYRCFVSGAQETFQQALRKQQAQKTRS